MRIELTSLAWEARVIAIIRHPQPGQILKIEFDEKNEERAFFSEYFTLLR